MALHSHAFVAAVAAAVAASVALLSATTPAASAPPGTRAALWELNRVCKSAHFLCEDLASTALIDCPTCDNACRNVHQAAQRFGFRAVGISALRRAVACKHLMVDGGMPSRPVAPEAAAPLDEDGMEAVFVDCTTDYKDCTSNTAPLPESCCGCATKCLIVRDAAARLDKPFAKKIAEDRARHCARRRQ